MRTVTLCSLILLPLLTIQAGHAEHFYKWVDEAGATHYTQTPPPQKKAANAIVKVSTKLPADSDAAVKNLSTLSNANASAVASTEKTSAKEQAAADAERRKSNAAACAQTQASLAQLQNGQRMRSKDAYGERTYLTDEQKAAEVQKRTTQIQQNCPK